MDTAHLPHIRLDLGTYYRPYHRVVVELVCRYTPEGGKVLDIGAGRGELLALTRECRPDVKAVAADISEACLKHVRERLSEVQTILLSDRPEYGGPYDTVVLCHTLEHTPEPLSVLAGVKESLKEGGHVILAVPNPLRPQVIYFAFRRHHYVNHGHAYAWDPSHWRNFLENYAELDVIEYSQDDVRVVPERLISRFPRFYGKVSDFQGWLGKRFPWYAFSNIAVAKPKS